MKKVCYKCGNDFHTESRFRHQCENCDKGSVFLYGKKGVKPAKQAK